MNADIRDAYVDAYNEIARGRQVKFASRVTTASPDAAAGALGKLVTDGNLSLSDAIELAGHLGRAQCTTWGLTYGAVVFAIEQTLGRRPDAYVKNVILEACVK